MPQLIIHAVTFSDDEPSVLSQGARSLFNQYCAYVKSAHNVDLSFQSFTEELNSLPGKYSFSDRGGLWVAILPSSSSSSSSSSNDDDDDDDDSVSYKVVSPNSLLPGGNSLNLSEIVGVIALRPLSTRDGPSGEVKRMYVKDTARGKGIGRALASVVIKHAESCGYMDLKLDSLERLGSAIKVYEGVGKFFVTYKMWWSRP